MAIRHVHMIAPRLVAALASTLIACGAPSSASPAPETTDDSDDSGPSNPIPTGSGGSSSNNDPGGGGTGGLSQDPLVPRLDVSNVVDFPAGITVASPMSGNVGNGGPPGPPLPPGQGAMASGSPSTPQ